MKHLRTFVSTVAFAAVTACVPQTKPPQQSVPPTNSPPTMTIPTPGNTSPQYRNWLDAPQTPGDWTYAKAAQTTSATFGEVGKSPRFRLTCDQASGRITLARLGITAAEGMTMKVRTESVERDLPTATPNRRVLETLAYLPSNDPLLDAMAFSKGRFAIELDLMKLYLPSWPEVTRVIEDCR